MSGFPSALNGQIVHSIDFQRCVEATRFEAAIDVPLNFQAGFAGSIGISQGIAPILIRLQFAVPAAKAQFNFMARLKSQAGGPGFSYDFWEGNEGLGRHWLVRGCFVGNFTLTNDPKQGQSDKPISIMGQSYEEI